MDSDSISHVMVCKQLLTDDDMEVINKCSTNSQRNALLLDHVLHMSASELFAFRDIVQELDHQHYIITVLSSGMYITEVYYIQSSAGRYDFFLSWCTAF